MTKTTETDPHKKIYTLLLINPGLNRTQIGELLHLSAAVVEKCIQTMEEHQEISVVHRAGQPRYYVKDQQIKTGNKRSQKIQWKSYELIAAQPGLHLSKIAKLLNLSIQLTEYHLSNMEKNNLVVGIREEGGYYKRFYIKDIEVGTEERKLIALLRQEHFLKIVLCLLRYPAIKHKELGEKLAIAPSTLSHHLTSLEECGLVKVNPSGSEQRYIISDAREVLRIIRKYHLETIIDEFTSIWSDLSLRGSK